MAIHSVFVSPRNRDGSGVDLRLRVLFNDVYRVGAELWLIDTARDAETVTRLIRTILAPADKTFVGVLSRDVCSGLSRNAQAWLNAPTRCWGRGEVWGGEGQGALPAVATPIVVAA